MNKKKKSEKVTISVPQLSRDRIFKDEAQSPPRQSTVHVTFADLRVEQQLTAAKTVHSESGKPTDVKKPHTPPQSKRSSPPLQSRKRFPIPAASGTSNERIVVTTAEILPESGNEEFNSGFLDARSHLLMLIDILDSAITMARHIEDDDNTAHQQQELDSYQVTAQGMMLTDLTQQAIKKAKRMKTLTQLLVAKCHDDKPAMTSSKEPSQPINERPASAKLRSNIIKKENHQLLRNKTTPVSDLVAEEIIKTQPQCKTKKEKRIEKNVNRAISAQFDRTNSNAPTIGTLLQAKALKALLGEAVQYEDNWDGLRKACDSDAETRREYVAMRRQQRKEAINAYAHDFTSDLFSIATEQVEQQLVDQRRMLLPLTDSHSEGSEKSINAVMESSISEQHIIEQEDDIIFALLLRQQSAVARIESLNAELMEAQQDIVRCNTELMMHFQNNNNK